MESVSVHIAVLAIAEDPSRADLATCNAVIEAATARGHEIVDQDVAGDSEAMIRDQLVRWIADPNVDVVIVTGSIESRHASEALAPLVHHAVPGFTDVFRWLAFQEMGASAMQSNAEAARCESTFVFVLPAHVGAVSAAMDRLILPQLDPTTKPQNLVEHMPRLRDSARQIAAEAVPRKVTKESTARGGVTPKKPAPAMDVPAAPVVRGRHATGKNVIRKEWDPPTRPIDLEKLERQIALSNAPSPNDAVTKEVDLASMMPPVRAEDTLDDGWLEEEADSIPAKPPTPRGTEAVGRAKRPSSEALDRSAQPVGRMKHPTQPGSRPRQPSQPPPPPQPRSSSWGSFVREATPVPSSKWGVTTAADEAPTSNWASKSPEGPTTTWGSEAVAQGRGPGWNPETPEGPTTAWPQRPQQGEERTRTWKSDAPPRPTSISTPPPPVPPARPSSPTPPPPGPPTQQSSPPPAPLRDASSNGVSANGTPVAMPERLPFDHVDLRAFAAHAPTLPASEITTPVLKKKSRAWLVVLLLLVVVGAGGYFAVVYWMPAEKPPTQAVAQPPAPAPPPAPIVTPIDAEVVAVAPADAAVEAATPVDAAAETKPAVAKATPKSTPTTAPKATPKSTPKSASSEKASEKGSDATTSEDDKTADKAADPDCDEVSCVMTKYERPCCERYRPREPNAKPGIPEELDKAMIKAGVETIKPRVIACGEGGSVKGTVKLSVTVADDGRVKDVSVADAPDTALGECCAEAMRKAKFGKTISGGTFIYPFVF